MIANPKRFQSRWALVLGGALWVCALGTGMTALTRYQMTPGAAAAAMANWPGGTTVPLAADRTTLVMFVHPKCPCSVSSMEELARAMQQCGDRVAATVVFFKPADQADDWTKTGLWQSARAIPGVVTLIDSGGALARRFDAQTSGQVYLYDRAGRLMFSGGITGGRGHAGDNAGLDAVIALLEKYPDDINATAVTAPVYGCSILDGRLNACVRTSP